jgi:hypothetical protein
MTKPATLPAAQPPCFQNLQEYHLLFSTFPGEFDPRSSGLHMLRRTLHLPCLSVGDSVWANPLSLAANNGISIDFSSCWYSDVSFPSVRDPFGSPGRLAAIPVGSNPFGNPRIKGCMRLPGAYRSLPRPSSPPKPSHPPYGVGALRMSITSRRMLARTLCTATSPTALMSRRLALRISFSMRRCIFFPLHELCFSTLSTQCVIVPRYL